MCIERDSNGGCVGNGTVPFGYEDGVSDLSYITIGNCLRNFRRVIEAPLFLAGESVQIALVGQVDAS